MDVAVFMATICPIAAVAVLPLAVANGGMVGLSAKGWIFTLLLTFIAGVAANGLMVYAQRTIQIGTIAVAQVVQPAIAVVWSFLLLGETVRTGQVIGIAIATIGLACLHPHQPARRTGESEHRTSHASCRRRGSDRARRGLSRARSG